MRQFYEEYSNADFLEQAVPELARLRKTLLEQAVPEKGVTAPRPRKTRTAEIRENSGVLAGSRASVDSIAPRVQALREFAACVPWGHHVELLKKVKNPAARLYYLRATSQLGWSRKVLLNQIKAGAYERAVTEKKSHNFALALPEHFAEQADEMMKSSYNLEFLGIGRALKERELENRLIEHLQQFILELGYGFCFVGRQFRLTLGNKEYFVDLLFYHRFLRALVAFDLKLGPFEPEHAGQMDFYLTVLNDKERGPGDQPSIGIILCAEKDDIEVEYALRTKMNPIGVAEYQLQSRLPARFKGKLPTARQLSDAIRRALPAPE
jgi:predicted nuclease of restriction endonuclease-like (RecB) superfamily